MTRKLAPRMRVGMWALRAACRTTWQVRRRPLDSVSVTAPPPSSSELTGTVAAVLSRTRRTCLVRALVLQSWHAAHGDPRDLLVGVTSPGADFAAHAWLEGERLPLGRAYTPLVRRAPGGARYAAVTSEHQETT